MAWLLITLLIAWAIWSAFTAPVRRVIGSRPSSLLGPERPLSMTGLGSSGAEGRHLAAAAHLPRRRPKDEIGEGERTVWLPVGGPRRDR
jgi:hypothetical protein